MESRYSCYSQYNNYEIYNYEPQNCKNELVIPDTCRYLYINLESKYNKLPTKLSDNIEVIICNDNGLFITELPQLPLSLKKLCCYNNNIKYLPEYLPISLENLACYINPLVSMPQLPSNLYILDAYATYIIRYPELPNKIINFSCGNNFYKPRKYDIITKVEIIPNIPKSLEIFKCDYNNLSELPELTDKLYLFNCFGNPIKYINNHNYEIIKNIYVNFGIYLDRYSYFGININETLFYTLDNYNYYEFFGFLDSDIKFFCDNSRKIISENYNIYDFWRISDIKWKI